MEAKQEELMSTATDYKKCKQCGYEFGVHEFNCRTCEWNFDCLRCGHTESQRWITDNDGTRIGWKHEILEGHGAVWVTGSGSGISKGFGLRSAREVEDFAEKMRASVAKREINPRSSYVTKWNPELKRAELAAGSWCQDGGVFGAQPFDMAKFPVDMIDAEEE
jgi:hypothetical protein